MKRKSRHTLITAEILGFFLIIIALLGILTGRQVFIMASYFIFALVLVAAAMFAIFATLAVKEHKGTWKRKKKK